VQDTLGNCAIELYNPTNTNINLAHYYISATQNSSISYPPLQYALTGNIPPFHTFVAVNSDAPSSTLRSKANQLIKNFNFNGKNAISLEYSNTIGILLDKIGDYTIPFTDSGWVVGTGSTRNHDLVRLKSVSQGNVDWSTAQYEWVSHSMDTYTNLGWDSSMCAPQKDPNLILSLGNGNTSCGSSSTFLFDVIANSSPSTQFNYCHFHIYYDTTVFGNSSLVTATQGSSFSGNGYNNPTISAPSPTVLDIQFGDSTSAITPGTVISSPVTLLTISLPIKSCLTSDIYFTDTVSTFGSNFFVQLDTTGPQTTTHLVWTQHTDYSDTVSWASLLPDSCYDSGCGCNVVCGYTKVCPCTFGVDSTAVSVTDTTGWNVTTQVMRYNNTYYSGGSTILSTVCSIDITGVSPSLALAGTGDIVTISGNGFGNVEGFVYITDANQGASNIPLDDIPDFTSWTENEIKIKLPSVLFAADSTYTPGSGPITVQNSCYAGANDNLTVYYNMLNTYITNTYITPPTAKKVRSNIVLEPNSIGSYYFQCDTSISNNDSAYLAVKAAIRRWNCVTGVNWNLGPPSSLTTNDVRDGVCTIYFSNSNIDLVSSSRLANTNLHYLGCTTPSDVFVSDADMATRLSLSVGKVWNYDTVSGTIIPSNAYSFYETILHELGHIQLLNHINASADLMYRTSHLGGAIKDITTWPSSDQAAAKNAIDSSLSVSISSCGYTRMIPDSAGCSTLGIETLTALIGQLNVFPNPSDGDITISYQLNTNAQVKFKLMDYLGREVLTVKSGEKTEGVNSEKVNIANLASGIYFLVANINGSSQTVKIVKP
jgi:hypothetical protein